MNYPVSIKKLAIEAGLKAQYGSDREGLADFDYRKFAQLIIKECEKVVEYNFDEVEPWLEVGDITNHFKD